MDSENLTGADNQQERPGIEQWIVGFVDGEGCFSCPIQRNREMTLDWQCQPRFAVVQGERSIHVLELIKDFFGCGRIYRNRRHDNHREDLFVYNVWNRKHLSGIIVPFFEANPLRTAKLEDFLKFRQVLMMMERKMHLSQDGSASDRSDNSDDEPSEAVSVSGILRGHTPADSSRRKSRRYGPVLIAM